jgi:hypothetical protein
MSPLERRAFGLFAQNNPLPTLTPDQRKAVGATLGIHPDNLETAYAYAMTNPPPPGGPWPEPPTLSAIDKRTAQLGNAEKRSAAAQHPLYSNFNELRGDAVRERKEHPYLIEIAA